MGPGDWAMTLTARDNWIDRARAENIETELRERGILKSLKKLGRKGTSQDRARTAAARIASV